MNTYSKQTARRFVLGRQGLWPGRRCTGVEGTATAMRASEGTQMDPLNVVARSHDIFLWSRVHDYRPAHFDRLLYTDRRFFDYGGSLFAYPMQELPYWRVAMHKREQSPRVVAFREEHPGLMEQTLAEVGERGPVGNRDFEGTKRVTSYRGRKDTAVALFYLWLTGELMIHHRDGFERVYDLLGRIAPPEFQREATEADAERFFGRKSIAEHGMLGASTWRSGLAYTFERLRDRVLAKHWLQTFLDSGEFVEVRVEGSLTPLLVLGEDVATLDTLEAGDVPPAWTPLSTTTEDEAVFLAPLDVVSARGRAAKLFGFEYIWEVYKPAAARRWGYYTLPILWGDRLVARLDPKLDRKTHTLAINGFWLEADAPTGDGRFARALDRGLEHFAAFVGAERIERSAITKATKS
jgi:uncharacterized protein